MSKFKWIANGVDGQDGVSAYMGQRLKIAGLERRRASGPWKKGQRGEESDVKADQLALSGAILTANVSLI